MAPAVEHLVGRVDELGSLDRALGELDRGFARPIELVGEPGIGKTKLLRELGLHAEERRYLVLSGSASELEQDLPFSVFVDALDEYVQGLEPERLAALAEDVQTELAYVLPSLSQRATRGEASLQHERYRSHRAIRALLEDLAAAKPLVLVLDDLHWADAASVELLGALLRRPPAASVLMALAVRSRQMPERLAVALERAYRAGRLTRIELHPLTPAEARELLGDAVDAAAVAALYEESGGNPFYLEQLARVLDRVDRDGLEVSGVSTVVDVPATVAAALTDELTGLSDGSRLVLEGAAVAGDPFELELAAAAAGATEARAMDAIDELLQRDLVRLTDVPRRFRFRHPLVRRAVYEATLGGWRLGAHERCAEALDARGATAAVRAHHVERSAREGDLEAVAVLREAGEDAVRLAPASAARWFGDALRLLPQTAPVGERIELLLARAGALTAAGYFADSHIDLLEALTIVPDDWHAMRARITHVCAGVESLLGRNEQARQRLVDTLESMSDERSTEVVALVADLAVNAFWRARYQEMYETAERAVGAARLLDDAPLTAAALAVLALADSMTGNAARAESHRSEAADLVASLTDGELAGRLEAAAWLAGAELYLDRYKEADAHADRALAVARASGKGEHFLLLVQILGAAWRTRGKLAEAAELLDGGIEAARLLGNTHALVWNLSGRSSVALAMGDVELAIAAAQESVDHSTDGEGSFHSAEAAAELAAALLEAGRPDEAVELLLGSAGGEELVFIAGSARARYLDLLARCWVALDRGVEAERAAASARAWAAAVQLPLAGAWSDRAVAAVALHAGHTGRAAEHAKASATAADEIGAPVEAALSRLLCGRALAEAGDRDRATQELQRAATQLDECGALRYRDAAEQELGKLGHRVHRRTRAGKADGTGIESLTGRELQVARLVVDRRTNPEIAAELFLSQKTVETHLRNIFRKLGVSSRVELAREVERADRAAGASSPPTPR